jgi:two-component system OmpR family sensor kinase
LLSKNKNIQQTIINIVLVYLTTTILLIFALSYIYLNSQKNQAITSIKNELDIRANQIIEQLETLHNDYDKDTLILYPSFDDIKSNIYDIHNNPIYKEFQTKQDNFIYSTYKVEPHYLGAAYLVIQKEYKSVFDNFTSKIYIIIFLTIIFLLFTSFILAKILIRPLSENIETLNRFIKDTTHELNTPISAILGNIETLDYSTIDEKNYKKINRIKIASKTISTIYDDLSFLLLNNTKKSNNKTLNISEILRDRIEYFKPIANVKMIDFKTDISDNTTYFIDQLKCERLIDNIISNSIKYSAPNTKITISLQDNILSIEDQGCGMTQDQIDSIFIRYKRFNTSTGGFGIGYSIIKSIIDEYKLDIQIESKINKGTKVSILWQN